MKRSVIIGLVVASVVVNANTQVIQPVDPEKQADVDGEAVSLPNVQFETLSQGSADFSVLALPASQPAQAADVQKKSVDLNSMSLTTLAPPMLSHTNNVFPTVGASGEKFETKELSTTTSKAPITNRQIRAFTPSGTEELKEQLNKPR